MILDPALSLTAMVVQMQKTILQLSARVEALEAIPKAKVTTARVTVRPSGEVEERRSMAMICEAVARVHGMGMVGIRGPSRRKTETDARKEFCRLAVEAGHSTTAIGRYIYRDHTTVLHLAGRLSRRGGKLSVA